MVRRLCHIDFEGENINLVSFFAIKALVCVAACFLDSFCRTCELRWTFRISTLAVKDADICNREYALQDTTLHIEKHAIRGSADSPWIVKCHLDFVVFGPGR